MRIHPGMSSSVSVTSSGARATHPIHAPWGGDAATAAVQGPRKHPALGAMLGSADTVALPSRGLRCPTRSGSGRGNMTKSTSEESHKVKVEVTTRSLLGGVVHVMVDVARPLLKQPPESGCVVLPARPLLDRAPRGEYSTIERVIEVPVHRTASPEPRAVDGAAADDERSDREE